MRWREVEDLYEYWSRCPPVHEMVSAYVGYKPPEDSAPAIASPPVEFHELRTMIGSGRAIGSVGG